MSVAKLCSLLDGIHTLHAALGADANPDFLQKHYELARDELETTKLSFEDAACVAAKLKLMFFWPQDRIAELIQLTAKAVVLPTADTMLTGRKICQDYTSFPHHLTQAVWDNILSDENMIIKLRTLVKHLSELGLRAPSEPTFAMICACLKPDLAVLDSQEKYVLLQTVKTESKRCLDVYSSGLASTLEKLPEDRGQLQRYAFDCFNELVPCKLPYKDLQIAQKAMPLRSTHKAFKLEASSSHSMGNALLPCASNPSDLMSLLSGLFGLHPMPATSSTRQPLITYLNPTKALADLPGAPPIETLPGTSAPSHAMVAAAKPAAPVIEDKKTDERDPLEVIRMLKDGAVKKRPASSKMASKEKKQDKTKPSQPNKKSVKNAGGKNTKKGDQKKKELGGKVPDASLRMKLKPKGCSKCRFRPGCCDSCWKTKKNW